MILEQNTYVAKAEKAINECRKVTNSRGKVEMITTSQIRNLLAMTADIYNQVMLSMNDVLSEEITGRIAYLKIRFIYEMGRDSKMKTFAQQAEILKAIDEIGNSKQKYILFSRYMEALVAYHKFYGGKD
ncbi:MAG: type III-A CRISPR-associated protein Csm2 [Oliverpabstia sp.]